MGSWSNRIPFVGGILVIGCDQKGAHFNIDDIEVTIPPGAIPPGLAIHVEIGVALYGPFSFADGCRPVSPILWFCTQEDVELQLPVVFKLPHTVVDDNGIRLSFAKCHHYDTFVFREIDADCTIEYTMDSNLRRYGILSTQHHCFLCVQAKADMSETKDLAVRNGYCLHILVKQEDSFTYRIFFVCTFLLETCFSVSLY